MRWRGFKCLDRHLCLARHPSGARRRLSTGPRASSIPRFSGRAADAILSRVFLVASALTPRTHTAGVPFARWRATAHTLCLPGPPLGGSEGIGFPEQGDGNPLYTRMEILTLQKGLGSCKAHDPFFYEMPLCQGRGNSVVSRDERGVVGGLTSDKSPKRYAPCVCGGAGV